MNTYKSLKQAAADGRAAQQKMAANVASQSQIQITITGQFTTPEKCEAAGKWFMYAVNECKFCPSAAEIMSTDLGELAALWQSTRRHTGLVVNPVALTLRHAGKTITVY